MDNIRALVKEINQITGEFGSPEIEMSLGALAPSAHQKWAEEAYEKYRNWDKAELESEIVKLLKIVEIREGEFAEEKKKGWVGDFGPSRDQLEGARRALTEIGLMGAPTPIILPTKIASKLKDYLPWVAISGVVSLFAYWIIIAVKPKKTARGKYIEKYLKERKS